jgi:transaldolase
MPEATLEAVKDHGIIKGDRIEGSFAASRKTIEDLAACGVDIDDVTDFLETQGLRSFVKSWDELVASVTSQIDKARAGIAPAQPSGESV